MATEKQIPVLAASFVEHQRCFKGLPKGIAQWVIQHPEDAIKQIVEGLEELFFPERFFATRAGLCVLGGFVERILSAASPTKKASREDFGTLDLPCNMTDAEIRAELGLHHTFEDVSEFCAILASMIKKQWGGKSGRLLNNGDANIFYVRGINDNVYVVNVRWNSVNRDWGVNAFLRSDDHWFVGYRAFSAVTLKQAA